MAVIVRFALWFFGRQKPLKWADLLRDLLIVVGSYVVVILFSFVVNFFRVPGLLHRENSARIAQLEDENRRLGASLKQPEVPAQEQRKRKEVLQMVEQFSDTGRKVIQFILDHGDTPIIALHHARFGRDTHQMIRRATNLHLVQERPINNKTILTINPEFRDALAFVLGEEASSLANSTTGIGDGLESKK
jgi:hypothetical protein